MTDLIYTLSYYKPQTTTVMVRRPWWAFWRHDKLEHKQTMTRFVFAGLPEDEAKILMDGGESSGKRLAYRLMGGSDATMFQLETGRPATPYVTTTGHYVETAGHNLIRKSEPK
jgi:hypothetical protein